MAMKTLAALAVLAVAGCGTGKVPQPNFSPPPFAEAHGITQQWLENDLTLSMLHAGYSVTDVQCPSEIDRRTPCYGLVNGAIRLFRVTFYGPGKAYTVTSE